MTWFTSALFSLSVFALPFPHTNLNVAVDAFVPLIFFPRFPLAFPSLAFPEGVDLRQSMSGFGLIPTGYSGPSIITPNDGFFFLAVFWGQVSSLKDLHHFVNLYRCRLPIRYRGSKSDRKLTERAPHLLSVAPFPGVHPVPFKKEVCLLSPLHMQPNRIHAYYQSRYLSPSLLDKYSETFSYCLSLPRVDAPPRFLATETFYSPVFSKSCPPCLLLPPTNTTPKLSPLSTGVNLGRNPLRFFLLTRLTRQ